MSIVEFDGSPSLSFDASESEESTKCPWVEAVGLIVRGRRGEKHRDESELLDFAAGFAAFLGVFCPAFIRFGLVTVALNIDFVNKVHLKMFRNSQLHVIDIIFP